MKSIEKLVIPPTSEMIYTMPEYSLPSRICYQQCQVFKLLVLKIRAIFKLKIHFGFDDSLKSNVESRSFNLDMIADINDKL